MKVLKKISKIFVLVLLSVIAFLLVVLGSMNLLKFAIYSGYYSMKDNLCKNPGLSDGFVCQGICAVEREDSMDKFLVSGYMADGSSSRIYVTDKNDDTYYITLTDPSNKPFDGHAGGIAVNNDTVYIADGGKINIVSLNDILSAKEKDSVKITQQIPVNNNASFIFGDQNYLYVGEFHDGGKYITDHPYDALEGKNYAIVSRYSYSDLTTPNKIYSIRDRVQGFCYTKDGKIVLSTSYGLSSSIYYVYDDNDAVDSTLTLDGAPVYYLGACVKQIKGPAMAEGLDFYDGKIITLTESASNKYIFGKFFFANKIVSIDINK